MKRFLKKIVASTCAMVLFTMPNSTAFAQDSPPAIVANDSITTYATSIVEPILHTYYTAKVSITSGTLNVRSGPGTNYSIIGSLANGTKVNIDGTNSWENDTWMYISSPMVGWVSTSYLTDFVPRSGSN